MTQHDDQPAASDEPIYCFFYGAKSTEDFKGSIATQRSDVLEVIEREGNRRVAGEFEDEAASAFSGSRGPDLVEAKRAAIEAAAKHGTAELWVQHSDRLARGDGRKAAHLAEVYFEMLKAGVRLRSVQDDYTFSNPMLAAAIGERNHEDSARKSLAVKAGHRRRWESGKAHGGPPKDGYKLVPARDGDGKVLVTRDGRVINEKVIDPDRKPVIERIADLIEAGHTPGYVSRVLNRDGLKSVRGSDWSSKSVKRIIEDPYYAGFRVGFGEVLPGDHEPYWSVERQEKLKGMLQRKDPAGQRVRSAGRPFQFPALLRGVGFCARCGRSMFTERVNGQLKYYTCASVRDSRGMCHAPRIRAGVVEAQVLTRLETFVGDVEGWIKERVHEVDGERQSFAAAVDKQRGELLRVERRLLRARQHHDRLLDDDAIDPALLNTAIAEVARIAAEQEALAQTVLQAEARLSEWEGPDIDGTLDYFNDLREVIQGRVREAKSVEALNATLRKVLQGIWMQITEDDELGRVLLLDFVLHGSEVSGPPPELSLATRVDHWQRVLDDKEPIVPARLDPGTATIGAALPFRNCVPSSTPSVIRICGARGGGSRPCWRPALGRY